MKEKLITTIKNEWKYWFVRSLPQYVNIAGIYFTDYSEHMVLPNNGDPRFADVRFPHILFKVLSNQDYLEERSEIIYEIDTIREAEKKLLANASGLSLYGVTANISGGGLYGFATHINEWNGLVLPDQNSAPALDGTLMKLYYQDLGYRDGYRNIVFSEAERINLDSRIFELRPSIHSHQSEMFLLSCEQEDIQKINSSAIKIIEID